MTLSAAAPAAPEIPPRGEAANEPRPYQGLRPYTEEDRGNFFGRDADRDILIHKILGHELTLLFAGSGVGKSSLLQAAVLPRLKAPEHENLDVVYYYQWVAEPLAGLKQATLDYLRRQGRIDPETSVDLPALSLSSLCKFCTLFTRQPLVLILDQFEEFFRYHRYGETFEDFIRQLTAAILDRETPISVVISMREDFALELNAFKPEMPGLLFENFYRLEKLTRANAELALDEPVERFGFHYQPALREKLLDDLAVRDRGAHPEMPVAAAVDTVEPPYLQILCEQLWELEKHNPEGTIRLATYNEKGGASGLMESYVETCLHDFSADQRRLASLAFDHLVSRRGTKIAFSAAALARQVEVDKGPLAAVLGQLETARILRKQSRDGVDWYELYHDLFSASVGEWNDAYKQVMRRRRAWRTAVRAVLILLALFLAFDGLVNQTNHYLRHVRSSEGGDTIELWRGQPGTPDLFRRGRFLAETEFPGAEIEADKRFRSETAPVDDPDEVYVQLIGLRRSIDRIVPYWQDGRLALALDTASGYLRRGGSFDSQAVISRLAGFRSEQSLELLHGFLADSETSEERGKSILAALDGHRSVVADRLLRAELETDDSRWRGLAAAYLILGGESIDVDTLLELIREQEPDVYLQPGFTNALQTLGRAGVPALLALEPNDALQRAIELYEDGFREPALAVLGKLPEAETWLREKLETAEGSEAAGIRKTLGIEGEEIE